jgi:hypothetical protein
MRLINRNNLILTSFFVIISCFSVSAANLYWVGGTGNWNDTSHWSTANGGAGGAGVPAAGDDVFFTSLSGAGTVTITAGATCNNIDFTGSGLGINFANPFVINGGTVNFDAATTFSGNQQITFSGNSVNINLGGTPKTLNCPVLFTGNGGFRTYNINGTGTGGDILNTFTITQPGSGIGNLTINFNGAGNRTIQGITTPANCVINFAGSGANNTVIGTGGISSTGLTRITVNNNLSSTGVITVGSGTSDAVRSSFTCNGNTVLNENTIMGDFCTFSASQNLNTGPGKIFSMGQLPKATFNTANSTTISSNFNGPVVFGPASSLAPAANILFYRNTTFFGNLDFGQYTRATFNVIKDTKSTFFGNVTTGQRSFIFFSDDVEFSNASTLTINEAATILASVPAPLPPISMDALFNDVLFEKSARMFFNNNFGSTQFRNITFNSFNYMEFNGINPTRITGTFTSNLDPATCSGWNSIRSAFTGGQKSVIVFDTPHDGSPGNKPALNRVIVQDIDARFGASPGTSGGLTILNGVNNFNNIGVTFLTPVTRPPQTFYWVGGTLGNPKSFGVNENWTNPSNWSTVNGDPNTGNGCIPTPIDSVVFNANSFTDVSRRNVRIDVPVVYCKGMNWENIPVGSGADSVFLDKDFDNNNTFSSIQVFGNLRLHPNVKNQFEGAFTFSSPVPATIESANVPFFGALEFDHQTGSWSIQNDINVDGGARGDISFIRGVVNANGFTISLEDDWTVYANNAGAGDYNGFFNPGVAGNTVIFDGPYSTAETQIIAVQQDNDPPGPNLTPVSPFYNIQIARTGGTGSIRDQESVILKTPIQINNNFTINSGALWDKGFQITGNATGTLAISDNAHLLLGGKSPTVVLSTNVPEVTLSAITQFPTNYTNNHLNLSANSTVWYIAHSSNATPQEIKRFSSATASHNYGNLYISNDGPKDLSGGSPATEDGTINSGIQGKFIIDNAFPTSAFPELGSADTSGYDGFPNVRDKGFQFKSLNPATTTMRLGGSCLLELGSATSGSEFPGYINDNVFIGGGSTVTYAAGVIQVVRGLNDDTDANQRYYNITLSNPNAVMVLKTFDRIAGIRNTLRIQSNNTLADAGYQMRAYPSTSRLEMTTNGAASSALILGGINTGLTGAGDFEKIGNTTIPVFNSYSLAAGNTVVYASNRTDADQPVAPLPPGNYYNLLITNWKPTGITYNGFTALLTGGQDVTTQKTMTSSITVDNNLTVDGTINGNTTTFFDGGFQIVGNAAGTMNVRERGVLKLGNGTSSTVFPTLYPVGNITLHANSTVTYFANTAQAVADYPAYGNLQMDGATAPLKSKTVTGANTLVNITGDLIINGFNNLIDNGKQITGNATDSVRITANGVMTIGNATVSTTFPTNYQRNNSHIFLNADSEVIYNAGHTIATNASPQLVAGGFSYGKLTITNPSANAVAGGNRAIKRLETANSGVTDLTINYDNDLLDNGFQIDGLAGRRIYMAGDTRLVLGTNATATQFPTGYNFSTSDIQLDSEYGTGEVVYNAGVNQVIKGLPGTNADNFTYVNLTLTNGTGTMRTKTLDRNTNVRQNITINSNNNFDASASDFDIFLQGNWIGNTGSNFTPRNGRVYFNNKTGTVGVLQNILTNNGALNNHAFRNITLDLTIPSDVQLMDDVTVTGNADFLLGDVITGIGSQRLIFTTGATATNANNNSHAKIGQVKKFGNQAFTFPLGNGTLYRYIGISAPSTATAEFTARYIDHNATLDGYNVTNLQNSVQNLSQPLQWVSKAEYWILDRGATTTDDVNVTLSWGANSGGVGDITKLRVARWNGSEWRNHNSLSPTTTGDVNNGDITSDLRADGTLGAINQFSPFTISTVDPVNPLPVTLITFKAEAQNKQVKLTWQTSTERNTQVFTVERSKDGVNFEDVTSIDAKGNSESNYSYSAIDSKPYSGVSYYRLRITDKDLSVAYSKTLAITISGEQNTAILYPNPSDGTEIFINASSDFKIQGIYDMTGRKVGFNQQKNTENTFGYHIHFTENLPSGTYILILISPFGDQVIRLPYSVRK